MSQRQRLTGSPEVVILGGGVTALEALMALRAHAGEELDIPAATSLPTSSRRRGGGHSHRRSA